MKFLRTIFCCLSLIGFSLTSSASDFFSTGTPDKLFSFGVRAGVNTSNQTISKKVFDSWNVSNWGTGFTLGVVAPINFRDFFAIEPGFFYESRSGNYTYVIDDESIDASSGIRMEYGKYCLYNFVIPIMAKVKFNVTSKVVWSVEAGPYFSVRLNTTGKNVSVSDLGTEQTSGSLGDRKKGDFGLKFGTGLQFFKHLYVGVHYNAGALKVWKEDNYGGHNKLWSFTAGWDF